MATKRGGTEKFGKKLRNRNFVRYFTVKPAVEILSNNIQVSVDEVL